MKIIIREPHYSSLEYSYLFKSRLHYNYKQRNAKKLKNIFVANNGAVLKNGFLVIGSLENLIGKYDKNFYFHHWKQTLEQFVVAKYGKSLKSINLTTGTYYSIHTPWFGYFSWLTSYLPRLIKRVESNDNSILIVPEEWDNIAYVSNILSTFQDLKFVKIPTDHHVFVENYYLEPIRPWTSHFIKSDLLLVKTHYNKFVTPNVNATPFRRVYISRRNASRRKVVNEEKLVEILLKFDFEIIEFENLTVLDQVNLMNETDVFIGLHGAGLTNLMFMNQNTKVLELTPIISDFKNFRFPFWRIADLLNINYSVIFCSMDQLIEKDEYSNNIIVDLKEFESVLTTLI
jgi:hypothetical protein